MAFFSARIFLKDFASGDINVQKPVEKCRIHQSELLKKCG